ncbi:hypothetical protein OJ996_22785 [Luteolibacter sp. GHJ8]|uniref:Siderophore synthetase component n=1 Tax=Luteolibacter rhizosphaerae TaxID=2989719 RepID=A0ABT3G9A8_9BACT|nr:IucA/IucC family protein [Luteolibacter rhizosphaerae]MCW1916432.1 hypothetical protein [Luteolibacter rhizosphaerae]
MIDSTKLSEATPEEEIDAFAERSGFEAIANTYLREADPGRWFRAAAWMTLRGDRVKIMGPWVLELELSDGSLLALDIAYRSTVGKHRVAAVFSRGGGVDSLAPLPPFQAALALVCEIYRTAREGAVTSIRELELTGRLVESFQSMAMALRQRCDEPSLRENDFLASEQSLLLGHWLHPTPKSRQGMAWWQQDDCAPELKGGLRLHFFSVRPDLVAHDSAAGISAIVIAAEAFGDDLRHGPTFGEVVVPVHPLQAAWLLAQPHVREAINLGWMRYLGERGEVFHPTSSVRTLFRRSSDWMFKFSIPVKITNSLRRNRTHELNVGVVMTRLMRKLEFFTLYPYFHVLDDPAFITVRLPGHRETGFETIIRSNPFRDGRGHGVISIAALTQDPLPAPRKGDAMTSRLAAIIDDLADLEGRPRAVVARDWFEQYWQCAIEPLILLFDQHGIALEAHQQNSLLNVRNGYPTHYHFRDNQGFYLSKTCRTQLLQIEGGVADLEDLFFEDAMIFRRFGYYLIFNQLFSVIYRLGADGHLSESEAIALCRGWLGELHPRLAGPGNDFVAYLLTKPALATKANLLTRVRDVDELEAAQELAVYVDLPNPFAAHAGRGECIGKGGER